MNLLCPKASCYTGKRNEPLTSAVCLFNPQLFHVFFNALDKDIVRAQHYCGNRQSGVETSHWMTMYNLCNLPPSPFNTALLILLNTGLLLIQES